MCACLQPPLHCIVMHDDKISNKIAIKTTTKKNVQLWPWTNWPDTYQKKKRRLMRRRMGLQNNYNFYNTNIFIIYCLFCKYE